jgi:hypothetical protein
VSSNQVQEGRGIYTKLRREVVDTDTEGVLMEGRKRKEMVFL